MAMANRKDLIITSKDNLNTDPKNMEFLNIKGMSMKEHSKMICSREKEC